MRDKEDYRNNLAMILEASGGEMMVPVPLAAKIIGVDKRTLVKIKELPIRNTGAHRRVSAAALARWMS